MQPSDYKRIADDTGIKNADLKRLLFLQGPVLEHPWTLGFKDRGMGNGDFAVMCEEEHFDQPVLVLPCPTREVANHIIEQHNNRLRKLVYVVADPDNGPLGIDIFEFPKGCMDVDELLEKYYREERGFGLADDGDDDFTVVPTDEIGPPIKLGFSASGE